MLILKKNGIFLSAVARGDKGILKGVLLWHLWFNKSSSSTSSRPSTGVLHSLLFLVFWNYGVLVLYQKFSTASWLDEPSGWRFASPPLNQRQSPQPYHKICCWASFTFVCINKRFQTIGLIIALYNSYITIRSPDSDLMQSVNEMQQSEDRTLPVNGDK